MVLQAAAGSSALGQSRGSLLKPLPAPTRSLLLRVGSPCPCSDRGRTGITLTRLQPAAASSSHAAAVAAPRPQPHAPAGNPFLTVVLPTALTLMLCNMDRICLSIAILPMSKELGWPVSMQGVIQSAFLYGYMATQLLGGTLADRYGGKMVMACGIVWFSAASLLLPLAASEPVAAAGLTIPAVLAARCMVGLGEGVALPTMNNLVANHFPKTARSRALGMSFSGFHSGNLLGLIVSPLLLLQFGWRSLFSVFGMLGVPLLAIWLAMVPSKTPAQLQQEQQQLESQRQAAAAGAAAGAEEAAGCSGASCFRCGVGMIAFRPYSGVRAGPGCLLQGAATSTSSAASGSVGFRGGRGSSGAVAFKSAAVPTSSSSSLSSFTDAARSVGVRELLSHSATWAIVIVNIINHWGYFIYLNWMPTYFSAALGFDLRASSFLSFLPWLVMATGSSAAGLLADTLISRGMPVVDVRKRLQTVAFVVPAVALLLLAQPGLSPGQAVAAMTVALGTTSLGQAGFVANMSDIAPRHAGQMFGLCNTFGSLSGIVGVTAVGFIVEATRSFSPVFLLTAALYLLGALAWNLMCVGERVF